MKCHRRTQGGVSEEDTPVILESKVDLQWVTHGILFLAKKCLTGSRKAKKIPKGTEISKKCEKKKEEERKVLKTERKMQQQKKRKSDKKREKK